MAITAGSRGIANIDWITRTVADELNALGLQPFIVPTMGSHGKATAEGQRKILEHYGILGYCPRIHPTRLPRPAAVRPILRP